MFDCIIIGGGPAGVSAALYLIRAGRNVAIVDNRESALLKAEKIENYYGHSISGEELFDVSLKNVEDLGVEIIRSAALDIEYGDTLTVCTLAGDFECRTVLLATGRKRNKPDIKGLVDFEGKGVSYCAKCDGFFYRGKKVAVIGDSEYALNEASELNSDVIVLTNGLEPKVEFENYRTEKITQIKGDKVVSAIVFDNGEELAVDGVFVAMGTASGSDLALKLGIFLENGNIKQDKGRTNLPNVFAAGDCTGGTMQIAKAVHEGMVAAEEILKYFKDGN